MNRMSIVLVAMVFEGATALATGTLQIGDVKVEANQVVIPVILGGDVGNGISAMDFRLNYNPEALQPVSASAGAAATRAEKQVMANAATQGEFVVVMMGMNQTTCAPGEVAKVVMQRVGNADDATWGLDIRRPTLSAGDGTIIASEALPYSPAAKPDAAPGKETPPGTPSDPGKTPETSRSGTSNPASAYVAAVEPDQAAAVVPETKEDVQRRVAEAVAGKDEARDRAHETAAGETAGEETAPDNANENVEQPGSAASESGLNKTSRPRAAGQITLAKAGDSAQTVEPVNTKPSGVTRIAQAPKGGGASPIHRYIVWAGIGGVLVAGGFLLIVLRRRLFG